MSKRYAAIWFRHLTTDWLRLRRPELRQVPFAFARAERGRMIISGASPAAESKHISPGMLVADAKVFEPALQVVDAIPGLEDRLLKALGRWCIRYTPVIGTDPPDGLILDITGCTHLWGGESAYLKALVLRLRDKGYDVRIAIADSIGAAWAVSRYGKVNPIVEPGAQLDVLLNLPPAALRLEPDILPRLHKLGLTRISNLLGMPSSGLRKRFGENILLRLRQALGQEEEFICPLQPIVPYEERLPCLEPVLTAGGIEIAMKLLLEKLCLRLSGEGKGLRTAILTCFRIDGKSIKVQIGTNRATANATHIFKLFALKIPQIRPDLGIELFLLEAKKVEDAPKPQATFWKGNPGLADTALSELLDRIAGKSTYCRIRRYLPDAHYWPERSFRQAGSLLEEPSISWPEDKPRPVHLLPSPEPIKVSAPIPDYPPMLFHYKGRVHHIRKADGPERIEREWWLEEGEHRDYYYVEDEHGRRYWIFRSGHYTGERKEKWFIHGFFA